MARRRDFGGALAGLGQQLTQFGMQRSAQQQDEERLQQQQQAQSQGQVSDLVLKLVPLVQGGMPADQALALLQSTAPQGAQLPGIDFSKFEPSEAQRLQPILQRLGTAQFASDVETPEALRMQAQAAGVTPTMPTGMPTSQDPRLGQAPAGMKADMDNPMIQQLLQAAQAQRGGLPFREGTQQRFDQDLTRKRQEFEQMSPLQLQQAVEQTRATTTAREEAQEPFEEVAHKRTLETVRANQAPRQEAEPKPRFYREKTVGDVNLRSVPGMRPELVGKPVMVEYQDGQPVRVLGRVPESGSSKSGDSAVERLKAAIGGGQGGGAAAGARQNPFRK